VPVREAVARCTNLRRRFGLMGDERAWARFLDGVQERPSHAVRLHWACEFLAAAPPPAASPFGCFSYEPPDALGVLRIHFLPVGPPQAQGPLARARMYERRAELRALFREVRERHPRAATVRGLSWLYHREAYTRLFPPEHGASAVPVAFPLHLNGSSTWGQVIDHRQQVRPSVRDALLARLPAMDTAAPWRIFPLQPLTAECPVGRFHDWYG
jgi:hypothetical protein